ncbi:histidine kinase [uncultured Aquimarina sp.]|uniref:sensor histidine kinase n=1 Tax=uncultured Aquimarina sp. TaxID=575652 RepID=UPI00261629E9|nr:histidine kinase [uncultured Aquimarina sp.]
MQQKIQKLLETSRLKYLVFGVIIFVFSASTSNWYHTTTYELLITYTIRTVLQIALAFVIIEFLVPYILNKKKTSLFVITTIITLLIFYSVCTLTYMYYFEVTFPSTYTNYIKRFTDASFLGRLTNVSEFISKSLYLLYPTFLIMVFKLYQEKQHLLELNQQKKTAELAALKHQLNPHFLFNTLNNLHALTLKKSDDTSKVIEKLSHILDYILYRCNDEYVTLDKEIELINNYLSLEKIRYGDRVKISFTQNVNGDEKIAPLLLLTFVENAFKHGVAQEINQANIEIEISKEHKQLVFSIDNSVPQTIKKKEKVASIGLKNIKEQLELLYPKAHNLIIKNSSSSFSAYLKLNVI